MAQLMRIPIMMVGESGGGSTGAKPSTVSRADLAFLVADFRKRPGGEMAIEYEDAAKQSKPVAGLLKDLEDAPDAKGVLWGKAEFTPPALEDIRAKKYRYLETTTQNAFDASGKKVGLVLLSVSLASRPNPGTLALDLSDSLDLVEHELDWLVRRKMTQQPDLQYGPALKLVASENRELIRRRYALQGVRFED
jgi:hypothetical protein